MNKDINELFKQDNKYIDGSVKTHLNVKVNKSIRNKSLLKGIVLLGVAIIGAAIFSWSLSLLLH